MQVILLEKIAKLGDFGETVKVRPGYGRNYLIPYGKALTATEANLSYFQSQREELEKQRQSRIDASLSRVEKLEKTLLRTSVNAAEDGKLYGSVSVKDVVAMFAERGIEVAKREITLEEDHIRHIGEYTVKVTLEGDTLIEVPLEVVAAPKSH